ncbi:MAG: YgfZ/GcvT domain-containing protein [Arenicella sp.]
MSKPLDLTVISITGDDAATFLQGQLTQDMTTIDRHWRYAAHCNPKGRAIALFVTFSHEGTFYLITPTELETDSIAQIKKYVMRSKVEINVSDYKAFYLHGDAAETLLSDHQCHTSGSVQDFSHPDIDELQFCLNLSTQKSEALLLSTSPTNGMAAQSASHLSWQQRNIQHGIARLYPSTTGEFTPEALNLDLLEAVNFKKGCYTGQEIVARMHYLGKAKKRLFLATLTTEQTYIDKDLIGKNIINPVENKKIGQVVDQTLPDDGDTLLLVSLNVSTASQEAALDWDIKHTVKITELT